MHLNYNIFILLILVVGFVLLVILRKLYYPSQKTTKDNSRKAANKITRIAESIILLCIGLAIFIFTATNTSTGGRLLILEQFPKGFVIVNIIVAIITFVGILIAAGFVYFKKTAIGVIILTVVLSCYGLVFNGPESILESIVSEGSKVPGANLTFYLSSPDVQGGELWVNGVHLGALPYETTYNEFYEKVPYWPEEPNENKSENRDSWVKYPVRRDYNSDRPSGSLYKPWTRILLPEENDDSDSRINPITGNQRSEENRTYYVRVKIGDEWGFTTGSSGTHRSARGQFRSPEVSVRFEFLFPERQEKIEKLLDIARLENYSPDSNWFKAMESFNSDGWIAVRKAMDTEPDMLNLLDAWATWKYDLDKVTDSKSAWKTFKRVYYEAEEQKYYMTSNIAGRAVELLVPKLDSQLLVEQGLRAIRSKRYFHWIVWEMNGRVQFGISYNSRGLHTGANMITYTSGDDMSPGDFMIAHAVWELDKLLDKKDDTMPNIVESVLVPEFIAKSYEKIDTLEIAVHIGGPQIEEYLLRQNWRVPVDELPWEQQMSSFGHDINGWLYLLANLKTKTGEKFRTENAEIIMDMSDVLSKNLRMSRDDDIDYLFFDNHLGEKSLAFKYWPRFKEFIAKKGPRDYLKRQYEYLLKMEPISKAEMYVQCWKDFETSNEVNFHEAIQLFAKADIPLSKREQIYSALAEHINKDVSNIKYDRGEDRLRNSLISILKGNLFPKNESEIAEQIFNELQLPNPKYKPENVAAWLATNAQTHPLVNMLAESDEPQLRLLVLGALRENPTPANREILEKLLNDNDEQVRNAAQEASKELENLKEIPLSQLAAQ